MTRDESILTAELFGALFVVSDVLLLATLLWLFDVATWVWPVGTAAVIGALFGLWVGLRWRRLDRADGDGLDPIERIKHRYATGEISEAALEARLEERLASKGEG